MQGCILRDILFIAFGQFLYLPAKLSIFLEERRAVSNSKERARNAGSLTNSGAVIRYMLKGITPVEHVGN